MKCPACGRECVPYQIVFDRKWHKCICGKHFDEEPKGDGMSRMSKFHIDWKNCGSAEEAEALAAGLYAAEEECSYCGGEGGEPAGMDSYVPCPVCNDGRG